LTAAIVAIAASALLAPTARAGDDAFQYKVGPVRIPDGHGAAKLRFPFTAPPSASVTAVRPNFRVRHRQTHQLRLYLKGPDGTTRLLSDRETHGRNLGEDSCGADPNGLGYTGFFDGASASLDEDAAPYTGYFLPNQPLTVFDGNTFAGSWKLIVRDTKDGKHGKLLCGLIDIQYTT
jgi:hypothetical protein